MALNNDQLAILATELTDDPKSMGYAGTSHPEAAALLNEVGGSSETVPNTSVPIHAVRDEIRASEWEALSQGKRDLMLLIFGNGDTDIDITNSLLVAQILNTFTNGAAPLTRAAMIALATRPASRGEVLFGANVVVTATDVAEARQL